MPITLTRSNYRAKQVSLFGGITLWLGLSVAHLVQAWKHREFSSARIALAAAGSGAAGFFDDLQDERGQNKSIKGLKGHIGALRERRVSAGLIKMLLLIVTAALAVKPRRDLVEWGTEIGIIAGAANLVNLLDLRPGRALKLGIITVLSGLPFSNSVFSEISETISISGCAVSRNGINLAAMGLALPGDLKEITMLGDTGANALGAALGATWIQSRAKTSKFLMLIVIVALTLASEKISFSQVIRSNSMLCYLDDWGRLPSSAAVKSE